jgi:hypothetical protein
MKETLMAELIIRDTIESVYKAAYKQGREQGYREVINHLNQCKRDYSETGLTRRDIEDLESVFNVNHD